MKLHEWIYELVCDVCYDREYVYASYVRHFGQLMKDILEQGKVCQRGSYEIVGMKSDLKAMLNWDLERCVNLVGLNVVSIRYSIESNRTGKIESQGVRYFELSAGDETVGDSGR
jgi:hypothetical protein